MESEGQKRACLIYVGATASSRAKVRQQLEAAGYDVCEAKADLDEALAAQAGEQDLPEALADCIRASDLCVFLLPEDDKADGLIGAAASGADSLDKPIIGVIAGTRTSYPEIFEDCADSIIREGSERLAEAIGGTPIWERIDRALIPDRVIKTIKCQ